ncbi:helix-turn-helix domain-containing protein [uncultured Fibrobacter sp.]|jgi:excisionase family DNA binding protein|uniref:helix-turn-helix domain-containing protein n=1 Tax=uncultured Fibrobacter sp. TaxID=261512 RepID=UPI0025E7D7CF|nr:helix-turn-helix domain-containing protein [uncultured Fibrobacter sp.]
MKNPKEKTYDLNGVKYLTITGMAEKLRCNPQTIQRKVAQKKIRFMRYLNKLLFKEEWGDEYLESLVVAPR